MYFGLDIVVASKCILPSLVYPARSMSILPLAVEPLGITALALPVVLGVLGYTPFGIQGARAACFIDSLSEPYSFPSLSQQEESIICDDSWEFRIGPIRTSPAWPPVDHSPRHIRALRA